jgi:F-type H+-transporting ATPase subunit b
MQIDLFTLAAQIVNFLILVFLLRLLLYKRIIRAMDERERRIASDIEDAKIKREDAEREAEAYREKKRGLDEERELIISRAEEEAEKRRRELMDESREEVEESRAQWYRALEDQRQDFLAELRGRAAERIMGTARTVLRDLADEELERCIVRVFLRRLDGLPGEETDALREALSEDEPVTVSSAFPVDDELRAEVAETLRRKLRDDLSVRFERSEDMIGGVVLETEGKSVGWSIDSYMDTLQEDLEGLLENKRRETSEGATGRSPSETGPLRERQR